MAVFDVRSEEGSKIDKIVFSDACYGYANSLSLCTSELNIEDEDSGASLTLEYEEIPNMILALQKAMEIRNKPVAAVVTKKAIKKK